MTRFDDFKQRFESGGRDPEAVVALLVEAFCALEQTGDVGEQMVALVCSKRMLEPRDGTMSGYAFGRGDDSLNRLRRNANIARSYGGGTPADGYQNCDVERPTVVLDRGYSKHQGVDHPVVGQAKFFVSCAGADNPRPLTLARNGAGFWKVTNFSSMTTGVRPPDAEASDF